MKNIECNFSVPDLFPTADKLMSDSVEQQYLVSFEKHCFWIAMPSDKELASCPLIFLFSGHGGTGNTCNIAGINTDSIAAIFRRTMLASGFGFVCAVCRKDAWGDLQSTEETLAAAEYCKNHGLNVGDKLNVMGFSMGGLGVLMFAVRHPDKIACLIDCFGVTDLNEFWMEGKYPDELGCLTEAERLQRSPLCQTKKLKDIPILIIHGDRDSLVKISYSERLYRTLQDQGNECFFKIIPEYGHTNDLLMNAEPEVALFLSKYRK